MLSVDVTQCPVLGAEKKTAWDTCTTYEDITPAFIALGNMPDLRGIYEWIQLERFVVLLYDRTSTKECVNRTRKQLFSKKGRAIVGLPLTLAALIGPTKKAANQADYCWGQMMTPASKLPSPITGVGKEGFWWMGCNLDNPTESIRGMQETLALWLQSRLQTWMLQMS